MIKTHFKLILLFFIYNTLFFSNLVHAQINIGGAEIPCLFACGGETGILNGHFFGDSVKEFVFEPTIDKVADKFDKLGSKYSAILDTTITNKLKDLNNSADEKILKIENILDDKIVITDKLAGERLREFDENLTNQRNAAEAAAIKIVNLADSSAQARIKQAEFAAKNATDYASNLVDLKIAKAEVAALEVAGKITDTASKRIDEAINKANDLSNEKILKIDQLATNQLAQLDDILDTASKDSLRDANKVISEKFNELDNSLRTEMAALIGRSNEFIQKLGQALLWLVILSTLGSCFVYSFKHYTIDRSSNSIKLIIGGNLLITSLMLVGAYYIDNNYLKPPKEKWAKDRDEYLKNGDIKNAMLNARALVSIDAQDKLSNIHNEKLNILYQYYTAGFIGNEEISDYTDKIIEVQNRFSELGEMYDSELLIALADIIGKFAENRSAQLVSATLAQEAIKFTNDSRILKNSKYLLEAYLLDPLTDIEAAELLGPNISPILKLNRKINTSKIDELISTTTNQLKSIELTKDMIFKIRFRELNLRTNELLGTILAEQVRNRASVKTEAQASIVENSNKLLDDWQSFENETTKNPPSISSRRILLDAPFGAIEILSRYVSFYNSLKDSKSNDKSILIDCQSEDGYRAENFWLSTMASNTKSNNSSLQLLADFSKIVFSADNAHSKKTRNLLVATKAKNAMTFVKEWNVIQTFGIFGLKNIPLNGSKFSSEFRCENNFISTPNSSNDNYFYIKMTNDENNKPSIDDADITIYFPQENTKILRQQLIDKIINSSLRVCKSDEIKLCGTPLSLKGKPKIRLAEELKDTFNGLFDKKLNESKNIGSAAIL